MGRHRNSADAAKLFNPLAWKVNFPISCQALTTPVYSLETQGSVLFLKL